MKADAADIQALIGELCELPGIKGTTKGNWPRSLYRVDDVRAAAGILNNGILYSRTRAQQLGMLAHDSAAPSVIGNSAPWIKDYVRLYFRPKTPTEYRSEGFRPKAQIEMGAHRPMPVVLVFEAYPILAADGTRFTNGNAATRAVSFGETASFLRTIPFSRVYHEGALKTDEKSAITFHRCAEVLVPGHLNLTCLRRILCRSQAELETLLDLIEPAKLPIFAQMVGVSNNVHLKRWTFLESVEKGSELIVFRFSPFTSTPEPFDVHVTFESLQGPQRAFWKQENFRANSSQPLTLAALNLGSYRVRLTLDGELAYSGTYFGPDSPF
jgi:hypothetical protein